MFRAALLLRTNRPLSAGLTLAAMREPRTRLCNLDRLLHAMAARRLDGIVATSAQNLYYLTGFNAVAHKSDVERIRMCEGISETTYRISCEEGSVL